MNRNPDVQLVLREWLADDGSVAPDRILDAVADRIAQQPRRRAGRLPRRLPMNPMLKYGVAAAAVLVLAVAGYNLLPRNASIGGPGVTPTPLPTQTAPAAATVSPTATPFPCGEDVAGCAGPLAAGAHASTNFRPAFTYTTPSGWTNSEDTPGNYEIDSTGASYLLLWSNVAISQHTATCDPLAQPGVGNTIQDWISFVTTHPGMNASTPVPVILGAARGQAVELTIKAGWKKTCPNFPGTSVQFIMHATGPSGTYGAASWIGLRLNVLDLGGETILVEEYGTSAELRTITDSMQFTATP